MDGEGRGDHGGAGSARAAWLGLEPAVRRTVRNEARRLRPHPDPAVAAVAARYARDALDHLPRRRLKAHPAAIAAGVLATLVPVGWMLSVANLGTPHPTGGPPVAAVVAVGVAGIAAAFTLKIYLRVRFPPRSNRILTRIEAVHRLALPATAVILAGRGADRPVDAAAPAAAVSTDIRYAPRRLWSAVVGLTATICAVGLLAGLTALGSRGLLRVAVLSMFGILAVDLLRGAASTAWVLLRWALPGRPIVTLDDAGVHLNAVSCCLPWAELAEVRIFPIRYSYRSGPGRTAGDGADNRNAMIAFVPAQPAVTLHSMRLSRRRRRAGSRALRIYGTSLSIFDQALDHTSEEIMAAVGGFAPGPVPVRRYG